jgi:hypothetical protein
VVLEKWEMPKALSDAGSAGKGGKGLRDFLFFLIKNYYFEPPKRKERYAGVDFFVSTRRELGIHAKSLGKVPGRGA